MCWFVSYNLRGKIIFVKRKRRKKAFLDLHFLLFVSWTSIDDRKKWRFYLAIFMRSQSGCSVVLADLMLTTQATNFAVISDSNCFCQNRIRSCATNLFSSIFAPKGLSFSLYSAIAAMIPSNLLSHKQSWPVVTD